MTVNVEVGGFLNSIDTGVSPVSVYPVPAVVIVPWKPGMVKVAVAPVPFPVVVNDTFW